MSRRFPPCPPRYQQRGVALFVVIVFVMLSMLLALWASRTSLFNELVVGNDADYQRAYEAAQALLQDAELDIRNQKSDGTECVGTGDVCRAALDEKIPLEMKDVGPLLSDLEVKTAQCSKGLCLKRTGKQDFWNNNDPTQGPTLAQMAHPERGARYGQFTGAGKGSTTSPANPLLQWKDDGTTPANEGGWYWIEVLPYMDLSKSKVVVDPTNNNLLDITPKSLVVYRITALAYGRKAGTQVVLQQTYGQQSQKN